MAYCGDCLTRVDMCKCEDGFSNPIYGELELTRRRERQRIISLLEGLKFGEKESSIGPNRHEYAMINQTLDEAITKIKGG